MKNAKRLICIIIAVLIFITAPVTSYSQVQAAELVSTMEMLQALLEMFGVSVGLGAQSDYFSQETFNDFATAVSNGTVYHMDQYGDVDFSDDASVQDWLEWANGIDEYITTSGWSPVDKYNTAIKAGAVLLDSASYKMTGTSATTAMHSYIDDLISTFGVSGGGTISLDARDAYSFFSGTGDNDDDDDEEAKKKRYRTRFAYFTGLTGALILTMGDSLTELVGLKHPETSDFSECDAAFEDTYFDGAYTVNADGQYVIKAYCDLSLLTSSGETIPWMIDTISLNPVVGYDVNNSVALLTRRGNSLDIFYFSPKGSSVTYASMSYSDFYSCNFPIYSSRDAAEAALKMNDFSTAENIVQNPYIGFKDTAPSAAARLPKYLDSWIMSPEYLQKLPSMITPVLDAADSSAGMTNSIDAVEDAIMEIAPDDVIDTEPDPVPGDSADYSGILGKILAAINKIISLLNPATYVAAFAKKFMTADSLTELLNSMPQLFAKSFADALVLPLTPVIAAIDAIPGAMVSSLALPDVITDAIASVFPRADDVADAIIGFPAAVASAVADIVIPVPDIVIPDIVIPDITIPDVITISKLDISDLSVPAMANPVIDLTLNPAYDITVANDFTGLDSVIATAVQGVLTTCFVPDEAMTMQRMGEMKAYFKFVDQITYSVNSMLDKFMNITPTPYLKIPLGHVESKYNYGLGEYWIIDISWYAKYKSFGDRVFLAICWIFFLWYLFVKLPGIIAGMEGSIMQANNSAEFSNDLLYPKFRPNSGKVNTPQDYNNAEKVNWRQRFTRRY